MQVAAELVPRSSWRVFEAVTTALILSTYAVLLTHPINLTAGDLGRHLKNGELFFSNGWIATSNLYSYTHPDHPFINHHWGSGVLFYLVEHSAGFQGLSFAFIAVSVLTFWLFLNLAVKYSSFPLAAVIAVVCMPILITRHEIRPEMFTYLISGLFLQILWGYRQRRLSFRALYFLPLLQILWVNLHIYFFLGIVIVGVFLFDSLIVWITQRSPDLASRSRGLAVILISTLLASCVNPAGIFGALYPLYIMQGYAFPVIENYSVAAVLRAGFNFLPLTYFLILFGLLTSSWVFVFAKDRSSLSYGNLLLSFMVTVMAWLAIRNFVLFAYFALPLSAANLKKLMANNRAMSLRTAATTSIFLAGVASLLFWISPIYFLGDGRGAFGVGVREENQAAAEFFRRENLQGPIFNNFDVGGYLIYYLYPKERVFVDNRPEAYPPMFFREEYLSLQRREDHWVRRSSELGFNVIFFNHRDRSTSGAQFIVRRALDPAWAPVFFDKDILILVKRYGPNHSTIEKHELAKDEVLASSN